MNEERQEASEGTRENEGMTPWAADLVLDPGMDASQCVAVLETAVHEVIHKLMDRVNDADLELPPHAMESLELKPASVSPNAVLQRAAILRRKLLAVLALLGVEPIDEVGIVADYGRHQVCPGPITANPEHHNKVAVCLLTGFLRGGKVIRPALVEVFQYQEPEPQGEESPGEED